MEDNQDIPVQQPPYIDRVYTALKENLTGFNKTPDQFKAAMQSSDYASKAYVALKENLHGFDKTPDQFYGEVGVKKKVSSQDVPNQYRDDVRQQQIADVSAQKTDTAQTDQRTRKLLGDKNYMASVFDDMAKTRKDKLDQINNPNSQYYQDLRANREAEDKYEKSLNIKLSDRVGAASNAIYRGLGNSGKGLLRGLNTIAKAITPEAVMSDAEYDKSLQHATDAIDKGVQWAKDYHGVSDEKEAVINKGAVNGMINGLAEFAPAIAAAERTGGMSFFINDYERGYENIDKQDTEHGLNLSEGQKQAYAAVNGTVSALLMTHNLHSLLGNATEKATQSVIDKVSQDVIGNLAKSGEDLTADNLKKATHVALNNIEDRVKNFGIKALKGTATSMGDLSALEALKIGTDKLANTVTGKKVFNTDNQAERMQEAIKNGIGFGITGAIAKSPMLLSKGGEERNSVIESLYNNPTPENATNIKDALTDHLGEKGFTEDEIKHTHAIVDQIHDIAKSLPKGLPEEKQTKVVDLIMQRKELEKTLSDDNEAKKTLDPAFTQNGGKDDVITQHRIDGINDQIKSIATDTPVKYFKEEGEFYKQFGDKEPEKIDEDRYLAEKPNNSIVPKKIVENESTNQKNGQEESGQKSNTENGGQEKNAIFAEKEVKPTGGEGPPVNEFKPSQAQETYFNVAKRTYPEMDIEDVKKHAIENAKQENREIPNLEDFAYAVKQVTRPEDIEQEEGKLVNSGGHKTVPETTFKDKIANLFTKLKGTSQQTKETIAEVTPEEAVRLKDKTGLDLVGYKHIIDNSGINHAMNEHSNASIETSRGQLPIEQSDFEKIPEIIQNYDTLEHAGITPAGRDVIKYTKTFEDGTTYYVEEVREGKKELALKTLYKSKERRTDADSERTSPFLTSETTSPDTNVETLNDNSKIGEPTGIRNADVAAERGKEVSRDVVSKPDIEAEGKRLVDSGDIDPNELANEVISNKKPITAEEQAALLYHKTKLKNEKHSILKDDNPENTTENQIRLAKIEDDIDKNQQATEIAGNVTGRALGFRTETMNEDYSRNSVFRRALSANGEKELDPKDREKLEAHTKRIDELENQLLDREEQIKKLYERSTVDRVKRASDLEERQAKREVTKASLRKEREGLLTELHLIAKKAQGELGANKIPIEMLPTLAKLARNYVLYGATTISGVVDKLYVDLKDHIEGLEKADLEIAVKENFDKYLHEQNEIRLNRAKKLQGKKLDSIKEQLETGSYEKRIQKKVQVDNDYLRIRAEINRQQLLINKKIAEIAHSQKSFGRKAADFAVKYGRQAKLASVTVLGKLAATGLATMGAKSVTEGVGAGISKVLPGIAKKSTIEGGINIKGLANSYAKAATQGMEDAYKEINIKQGGQSDLSALYGKYTATRLPAEAADFFGHLHSAIKAPIKRQAFEYSYAKRVAKGIEAGIDVQDPVIDAKNRLDAYKDGQQAIFMGDNMISKAYEASMKMLENSNSSSAQNVAALTRILLPFVKVPTNIALSAGRYSFGLIPGIAKLAQIGTSSALRKVGAETLAKVIHQGMGDLTPEESDLVLRNLKHGSVGGAALLIGFFHPKNVGGFYQEHEKRKKNDVKAGAIKVLDTNIPMFLTEHPLFIAMQVGATFRRVLDAHRHKDDDISAATLATVSGLAEGIPLANEAKQITDLFGADTKKTYRFISQLIKGEIEPAAMQQLAAITDTKNGAAISLNDKNQQKRAPSKKKGLINYVKQDLEMGIPGLRKNVPKK